MGGDRDVDVRAAESTQHAGRDTAWGTAVERTCVQRTAVDDHGHAVARGRDGPGRRRRCGAHQESRADRGREGEHVHRSGLAEQVVEALAREGDGGLGGGAHVRLVREEERSGVVALRDLLGHEP